MLTPAQGAITQLWAGTEAGIEEHNGAVWGRLTPSGVVANSVFTVLGPLCEVR